VSSVARRAWLPLCVGRWRRAREDSGPGFPARDGGAGTSAAYTPCTSARLRYILRGALVRTSFLCMLQFAPLHHTGARLVCAARLATVPNTVAEGRLVLAPTRACAGEELGCPSLHSRLCGRATLYRYRKFPWFRFSTLSTDGMDFVVFCSIAYMKKTFMLYITYGDWAFQGQCMPLCCAPDSPRSRRVAGYLLGHWLLWLFYTW